MEHTKNIELTEEEIELVLSHRRSKDIEENKPCRTGKLKKNLYFPVMGLYDLNSHVDSIESYLEDIKYFDEKEKVKIEKDLLKLMKDFLDDLFQAMKVEKGAQFLFDPSFGLWDHETTGFNLDYIGKEEEKDFFSSIKEIKK